MAQYDLVTQWSLSVFLWSLSWHILLVKRPISPFSSSRSSLWNAVCKPLCVCIICGVCTWKGVREFFRACVYSCVYMKVVCVYHYSCQYTHPIWYNTHLVYTCSTLMHTQHWNTCDSIYTHEFYKLPRPFETPDFGSYTHRGLQTALRSQTRNI